MNRPRPVRGADVGPPKQASEAREVHAARGGGQSPPRRGKLLHAPLALAAETGIPAHTCANTVTRAGPAIRASRSANAASNSSRAFASSSVTPPPPVTCVYATLTSSSRTLACAATWASAPSLSPSVE